MLQKIMLRIYLGMLKARFAEWRARRARARHRRRIRSARRWSRFSTAAAVLLLAALFQGFYRRAVENQIKGMNDEKKARDDSKVGKEKPRV